jgi:hypothetical protein
MFQDPDYVESHFEVRNRDPWSSSVYSPSSVNNPAGGHISPQFPLFDPDHPHRPHKTLMFTYCNSLITNMSRECSFIGFLDLNNHGLIDAALANGIASIGSMYVHWLL